ncbi:MAG: radical SAM protein [Desulfobacteraceae bacterium]|jgi:hypothetical protein
MKRMAESDPTIRERLLPYQGTWHLPWVVQRYLRPALKSMTPAKLVNAAMALIEMKMGLTHVASRPYVLRIEPCNVCSLRCPNCVCGANLDPRPKGFMKLDNFRKILEQNKATAMILRLDGMGEPSLHPELFTMVRMAKAYGLSVSISSNLWTPAWKDPYPWLHCGLDRLVVSIDGITQESFKRYRVGADLAIVVARLRRFLRARAERGLCSPLTEVQFIDFGYNHGEIPEMRRLARQWGADRFEVVSPQAAMYNAHVDSSRPQRCFWLWSVLTVGWNLDYRACTNSWSVPWPRLNLCNLSIQEFWNHPLMLEARKFNLGRTSKVIAEDPGCRCHRCLEMLVSPLSGPYFCE